MTELLLSTVVFLVLHSLLADSRVKHLARSMPGMQRWYRLAYSLLSTVLLAWVVLSWWQLPARDLVAVPGLLQVLAWLAIVVGAAVATLAVMRFGASGFLGLRPEPQLGLVRSGMHGRVRHPIYSGIIAMLLGWLLLCPTLPTLLVVALMLLYLPIGIHLEEQKLIAEHGEAYRKYRREVPALWPAWRVGRDAPKKASN